MLTPVLIAVALAFASVGAIAALLSSIREVSDDASAPWPTASTAIAFACALAAVIALGYALKASWPPTTWKPCATVEAPAP